MEKTINSDFCVFTITYGKTNSSVDEISHTYMEKYAIKIGADFRILTDDIEISKSDLRYHILRYKWKTRELLKQYKRVLYIDSDVLILPTAKNIFDVVPENCFGIFEEGHRYPGNLDHYKRYASEYNSLLKKQHTGPVPICIEKYYNSGVFVASKNTDIFDLPIVWATQNTEWIDQSHINMLLNHYYKDKINIFELPIEFNRMYCWEDSTLKNILNSSFIHYSITENSKRISAMKIHLSAHCNKFGEH